MKAQNGNRGRKKKYGFIGVRPVGNIEARLEKIVDEAEKRGERKTVSGLINECVHAHLPKLESKYGIAA
jgi:hypothetical protein